MNYRIHDFIEGKVVLLYREECNISHIMHALIFDSWEAGIESIIGLITDNDLIDEFISFNGDNEEGESFHDRMHRWFDKDEGRDSLILDDYSFYLIEFNKYGTGDTKLI